MDEFLIKVLIIEEDRDEHIAKHAITVDEVVEVVTGNYAYKKAREDRWLVTGKTTQGKFITIIVGERNKQYTYGLVTARPARDNEKKFYLKQEGGENDERYKSKTS